MAQHIFDDAVQLYSGFYIREPLGNNAFSFNDRLNQQIYVPPLVAGHPDQLSVGKKPVFGEIEDGIEFSPCGLKSMIWWDTGPPVAFLDNHNHAFFFWFLAIKMGIYQAPIPLIHIDQHSDLWDPPAPPPFNIQNATLYSVFQYTNFILNVGSFIQPAIEMGLISESRFISGENGFDNLPGPPFILDIDLDVFDPSLSDIEVERLLTLVQPVVKLASLVTIATSPYFIDQHRAISLAKRISNLL